MDEKDEGTAMAEDERLELQRLRKEIKALRMEKAILKYEREDCYIVCNKRVLAAYREFLGLFIGRRKGLKIPLWQHHAGSSLAPGIIGTFLPFLIHL